MYKIAVRIMTFLDGDTVGSLAWQHVHIGDIKKFVPLLYVPINAIQCLPKPSNQILSRFFCEPLLWVVTKVDLNGNECSIRIMTFRE